MGRKRNKRKTVENIHITGIADKGFAVGKSSDGEVLFIEGAVPGDIVDAEVFKKKKNHSLARLTRIATPSPDRITPFCSHFEHCGGCKWQSLAYPTQLHHKELKVHSALKRIAKLDPHSIVAPIAGMKDTKYYRNKIEYSFNYKRWLTPDEIANKAEILQEPALGFHVAGAFDKVLNIEECFLQNDLSNDIRNFLKSFCLEKQLSFYNPNTHEGFMRNIFIRNTSQGDWMVNVIFAKDDRKKIKLVLDALQSNFSFITSLVYMVNTKMNDSIFDLDYYCHAGNPFIVEKLDNIKYKIGPKSFFQTNSQGAKVLFDFVVDFADLQGHEIVYDLYTGLGSIALYIAHKSKWVVGIEEIDDAIKDANINAQYNAIYNTTFYAGDVQDILNDEFIAKHGKADVVITDPPRAGMSDKVIDTLLSMQAPKIVYVSCNPDTQARDLALLAAKYTLVRCQPVDIFPHTNHIENVALLVLS